MSTQIKDNRWDADPRGESPSHTTAGVITELAGSNAEATPYRAQDSMNQLVRQGQDASLKSLQVWADLARKREAGLAASTIAPFAYDRFTQLLAALREIADELVATQHQLAQQPVSPGTAPGDNLVRR